MVPPLGTELQLGVTKFRTGSLAPCFTVLFSMGTIFSSGSYGPGERPPGDPELNNVPAISYLIVTVTPLISTPLLSVMEILSLSSEKSAALIVAPFATS